MISFDGDGRMFVIEMRTYMQDIDGNNTLKGTITLVNDSTINATGGSLKLAKKVDKNGLQLTLSANVKEAVNNVVPNASSGSGGTPAGNRFDPVIKVSGQIAGSGAARNVSPAKS